MALSETFPAERAARINRPDRKIGTARSRTPISARELVEWTYGAQKAHLGGEMNGSNAGGISQTGIVVERCLLGCTIDTSVGGSGLWGSVYCDNDALTVHGIAETLSGRRRGLLIRYGEMRSPPEWEPLIMPLREVPVPGRKGKPRGIYGGKGRQRIAFETTYEGDWPDRSTEHRMREAWIARCERLEADGIRHDWMPWPTLRCADEIIANARRVYREWYEALWALCDGIEAAGPRGLIRYRISDLGAVYEPWRA